MKISNLLTLVIFINFISHSTAQISSDPCCVKCIDTALLGQAEQSSISGSHSPENAIGNPEIYALTLDEEDPYWQIDIQEWVSIREFKITTTVEANLTDYYIFTSYLPFEAHTIEGLLQDNRVESFRVVGSASTFSNPNFAPQHPTRYVRIQRNGTGVIQLYQVQIPGTSTEDCDNGLDDDCDDLIDCDDLDCSRIIYHVNYEHPSCEVCQNGSISFQYWAQDYENTEISIDGGISWEVARNFHPEYENLDPGEYNIMAKNILSGCIATWPENPIILDAPRGFNLGDCDNGGFENGNFDNWAGLHGVRLFDEPDDDLLTGTGFPSNRFAILDQTAQDPNGAPIALPFEGMFTLRLGQTQVGGNQEKIVYCFDVDEENKDLNFNYAVVLQDPLDQNTGNPIHTEPITLPYFEYKIYELANPNEPIDQLRVVADVNDPFFMRIGEDIAFKA